MYKNNKNKINYNDIFLKKFDKNKKKNKKNSFINKKEKQEIIEDIYQEEIDLNNPELYSNLRSSIKYEKYKNEKLDIIEEMILQKEPILDIKELLDESKLSNLLDTYSNLSSNLNNSLSNKNSNDFENLF